MLSWLGEKIVCDSVLLRCSQQVTNATGTDSAGLTGAIKFLQWKRSGFVTTRLANSFPVESFSRYTRKQFYQGFITFKRLVNVCREVESAQYNKTGYADSCSSKIKTEIWVIILKTLKKEHCYLFLTLISVYMIKRTLTAFCCRIIEKSLLETNVRLLFCPLCAILSRTRFFFLMQPPSVSFGVYLA